MDVTIYHNPACGTSRNTLALIRHAGIEPTVVEYLKTPPSRDELARMIRDAGLSVREAIREKGTPYLDLGLDDATLSDDQLLTAMLEHPILINRPFVVTPMGTRLARPSEAVLDILSADAFKAAFVKEDGEKILDDEGRRIV
ncbi:arsenate reductase (glutaredoxin) [Ensifer sesbaniae]|jgi:arsenate reductase|uniref:arsenate reductase (glutaredoxin) n=1 Tax=Ensifer sesbaniae TaxID=1214071 RepID=UPI001568FEBB|nr:arsenate reductase (glutaredoxin) [Ensifer sesbaniae]MCK3777311.1 arsenate reductase (glutaredoxin) [Ensifer sesbaniae]NRQ17427.1 Arsenate reductase [Ensifer sesbaniae]